MAKDEAFYRRLLGEQSRSGLSLRAFAESRGVPAGTLSWWRFKLKTRDADRAKKRGPTEPRFVPVRVVDSEAGQTEARPAPASATSASTVYEIVLRQGYVLRLPADFDDARVAALVRVVASC